MKKLQNTTVGKAQVELANINAQIQSLNLKRVALAQPLKLQYATLRNDLTALAGQIVELDPEWKQPPMKPKAEDKIREVLAAHGSPMTEPEILKEIGSVFSKWKIRTTLKKRFNVDSGGRFSVKA